MYYDYYGDKGKNRKSKRSGKISRKISCRCGNVKLDAKKLERESSIGKETRVAINSEKFKKKMRKFIKKTARSERFKSCLVTSNEFHIILNRGISTKN
ncbi:MAG: hypothetical protein MHMPM18_004525 [Marteilia pararefringens]